MTLPEDPFMLMSFVNMKLRDGDYDSLKELSQAYDMSEKEIKEKLKEAGFEYMESIKQFR